MTSKTLGNLTDATALTGTEQVYVVQSSNSRKTTAQDVADLGTSQDNMTDGTTNKNYTATEQTKLAGIATGATANTGTVTSAALSVPTGLSVSGSPITTSGTFAITYASGYEGFTTALKTLVNSAVQPADVREVLTANRIYYVATTGSDSNTGLTSGTALLTPQKAANVISTLDLGGFTATISIGAGTFTAPSLPSILGGTAIISGAGSTTILSGRTSADSIIGQWNINNVKFQSTVFAALYVRQASIILGAGIEFGTCTGAQCYVAVGGYIQFNNNYTISGGATMHWRADGGAIFAESLTITLTGTPAFSTAFALSANAGQLFVGSNTFSGSATGTRYNVSAVALIRTYAAGASYLPGDTAGVTSTGGQYV